MIDLTDLCAHRAEGERLAFAYYLRRGCIPLELKQILLRLELLEEAFKANPDWQNQPRVPAGQPEGGQWVGPGGVPARPRTPEEDLLLRDPPLQPAIAPWEIVFPLAPIRSVLGFLAARVAGRTYPYAWARFYGSRPRQDGRKANSSISGYKYHSHWHKIAFIWWCIYDI